MASKSARWLPAAEALRLCRRLFADEEHQAKRRLIQLAADDEVRTRCVRWVRRSEIGGTNTNTDVELGPVVWEDFLGQHVADWTHGTFEASKYVQFGESSIRLHGVHFSAADLESYIRKIGRAPTDPPEPRRTTYGSLPPEITLSEAERRGMFPAKRQGPIKPLRGGRNPAIIPEAPETSSPLSPALRRAAVKKKSRASKDDDPVVQDEVWKWYRALPPSDQALGHRDLRRAADKHFHPRHVMKKLIDPLTEGRPPGRRRKT